MDKILAPIKKRLLEYLEMQGITKESFYSDTGISASNFKGAGKKSELGGDKIAKILTVYPEIDSKWLITGVKSGNELQYQSLNDPIGIYNSEKKVIDKRPIIEIVAEGLKPNTFLADVKACAGFGLILDKPEKIKELPAIHIPNAPHGLNIAFQVSGDSFHNTIRNLDYVAGNHLLNFDQIRDGYVYIIIDKEDGVLVKRIYRNPNNDYINLHCDNPSYGDYKRHKSNIIAVFKAFYRGSTNFRNYHNTETGILEDFRKRIEKIEKKISKL